MRIAKFLAAAGIASRRQCEKLIDNGLISINGEVLDTPARKIDLDKDLVTFRDCPVTLAPKQTVLLNKPPGYTCSERDVHAEKLALELLDSSLGRLFSIGRLDRESEGLLLCTNDGELAHCLTHPSFEVPKHYLVWVDGEVDDKTIRTMNNPIVDDGETLRSESVTIVETFPNGAILEIILKEGKNREIRRICDAVQLNVTRLQRTKQGNLELGNLALGEWRKLTMLEINSLKKIAGVPKPRKV